MLTLGDMGERRILSEIIPIYATGVGDDCAEIPTSAGKMVFTTDPVPPPAARVLANDEDPYWMGWLLVTINASDIAASGGRPRSFLAALEMPVAWPVDSLHRLLSGIRDACEEMGFAYIGGNLREAAVPSATGFAVGECVGYKPLTRSGASSGDIIVSIGQGGQFWCDAMHIRSGGAVEKAASPLFRPVAQTKTMQRLGALGLVSSSMDTSDGLLPTLEELTGKSALPFRLELERLTGQIDRSEAFDIGGRAWLGWGDWTVVTTVAPENLAKVRTVAEEQGSVAIPIGEVGAGSPGLVITHKGNSSVAPRLESERFAPDSWFSKGIEGYISALMALPLP